MLSACHNLAYAMSVLLSIALICVLLHVQPTSTENGRVYAITDKGRGPFLGQIKGPMVLDGPYQVWSDGQGRVYRTRAALVIEATHAH